ncbi:MAG: tyrosine-protein phosphatase [Acidimicrobiales bacterium]
MHADSPPAGGTDRFDRVVEVDGVVNVRDAGGLPIADGGSLRRCRLFRSANLHALADPGALEALGIRTVVDLRRPDECEREPTPDLGPIEVVLNPVNIKATEVEGSLGLLALYDRILGHHGAEIASGVDAVADRVAGGVLVHCTAGKDRTGLVIGLIQSLLGVDDEHVIDDFALTGRYVRELVEHQKLALQSRGVDGLPDELFEAPAPVMVETFARLRAASGSIPEAAADLGVSSTSVERLRAGLTG